MKSAKIYVFMLWAAVLSASCSRELPSGEMPGNVAVEDYSIPVETALNTLENFLKEQGLLSETKGAESCIDNYFAVGRTPGTKAADAHADVIYAFNFKDDGGYALVAADKRINDDLIAFVPQGNVTEKDFFPPEESPLFADDNGDDLSYEEYMEMVATGVLAQNPSLNPNHLSLEFARRQIDNSSLGVGSGGSSGDGSSSTPVTYEWKVEKEVPRLVQTQWTQRGQDDIFNKYCPEVGLIKPTKAPAGCVCIAVSQIIAFHEYPSSLSCNGVKIDYSAIKKTYSYQNRDHVPTDEQVKEMLAQYIITVALACNTKYFRFLGEGYGFAWPTDAKKGLEFFGYKNVTLDWGYDENRVISALDNGCPVFISAICGVLSGHGWVIDGYIRRNYVSSTGSIAKKQTLVHCNWGWRGDCNGYFTSGVFNTQKAEIVDADVSQNETQNYTWAFSTITYDNPWK